MKSEKKIGRRTPLKLAGAAGAMQIAPGTSASISEIAFATGGAMSFTDLVAAKHILTVHLAKA